MQTSDTGLEQELTNYLESIGLGAFTPELVLDESSGSMSVILGSRIDRVAVLEKSTRHAVMDLFKDVAPREAIKYLEGEVNRFERYKTYYELAKEMAGH